MSENNERIINSIRAFIETAKLSRRYDTETSETSDFQIDRAVKGRHSIEVQIHACWNDCFFSKTREGSHGKKENIYFIEVDGTVIKDEEIKDAIYELLTVRLDKEAEADWDEWKERRKSGERRVLENFSDAQRRAAAKKPVIFAAIIARFLSK